MQLFNEGFYTEDFDQEMFDFIKAQGWSLDGETGLVKASLSALHLYYGTGIEGFWTDNDENDLEDYEHLTKQQFKEKVGMSTPKKRIGDYIDYDFHTPNKKEVREFLEKEFDYAERQFLKGDKFISTSAGLDYCYTTNVDWDKFISTEEFKQLIGMTNKEENVVNKSTPEGYQLADGTWSSEYKIGDKFVVVNDHSFSLGSIITFFEDDNSWCPLFKLESGYTATNNANGEKGAYAAWERLKAYKPEAVEAPKASSKVAFTEADTKSSFTKSHLKTG